MEYQQAENLIFESYNRVGRHLTGPDSVIRSLEPLRNLISRTDTQLDLAPAITVTGSKGKGSTAILGAALLASQGERVGLISSPAYRTHRERIRVNGHAIPGEDFTRIAADLAPHIEAVTANLPPGQYLGPNGLFIIVAMCWFAEQGVSRIVIEVGRGGRFDDASLIPNRVALITPIMGEHLDRLGPTLSDVAWHKAGVLPYAGAAFLAPQPADVQAVFHIEGRLRETRLKIAGSDFPVEREAIFTSPAVYLPGNLSLAWEGAQAVLDRPIDESRAMAQLAVTQIPGRCDLVHETPAAWVDGAINRQSARLALQTLRRRSAHPLVLVTSLPGDKDGIGVVEELGHIADHLIITQAGAGYLTYDDAVAHAAHERDLDVTVLADPLEAFEHACTYAASGGTIWVIGTQSLVAAALRYWQRPTLALWPDHTG